MKIVKLFGAGGGGLMVAALVLLRSVVKSIPVGPGATLVQPRWPGFGANVVVFEGSDRRVIVDSQLAPLAPILRWHLGELRPEERIVLTHSHADHLGQARQVLRLARRVHHGRQISGPTRYDQIIENAVFIRAAL